MKATQSLSAKTKKSAHRREEILGRSTELFDRKGFANTSLDDIARAVGIKREGIYYYFKNRSEILLNIIRPQSDALLEGLRAILDDSGLDHPARLHAAIRNHLERFDRYCLEMTVSLRDGYFDDSVLEVREAMSRIWKDYEQMWTELVARGQAQGAFRKTGDAKMLAFGILGMCNWLARWYDPKGSISVDDMIEAYFDMIGHGLIEPRKRR